MDRINAQNTLSNSLNNFTQDKIKNYYIERLKTGFPQLDDILGGGITEGTTILGATSGLGKSTFALQLAQNVAKQGTPVLFFSFEMSKSRIASKAISRQLFLNSQPKSQQEQVRIEADQLLNREYVECFGKKQWNAINTAREMVNQETANLYIIEGESSRRSANQICKLVEEFMENNGKPLVIVDYLQILPPDHQKNSGDSRYTVEYSMKILRDLSMKEKIPVILISSLNRDGYDEPIQFKAFKETGMIEYSADEVLGLQFSQVHNVKTFDLNVEKAKNPRNVEITVLKQRYGKSGNVVVPFEYYAQYDCFVEIGSEQENTNKKNTKTKTTKSTNSKSQSTEPTTSTALSLKNLPTGSH